MSAALTLLLLALAVEDFTTTGGARVVLAPDRSARTVVAALPGARPPRLAEAPDLKALVEKLAAERPWLVVLAGGFDPDEARALLDPRLGGTRPSPAPFVAGYERRCGPPSLTVEFAEAPEPLLDHLAARLRARLAGDGVDAQVRIGRGYLIVEGGQPAAARWILDEELARPLDKSAREAACAACLARAAASRSSPAERARRLLEVTLATGNPRREREIEADCARAPELAKRERSIVESVPCSSTVRPLK